MAIRDINSDSGHLPARAQKGPDVAQPRKPPARTIRTDASGAPDLTPLEQALEPLSELGIQQNARDVIAALQSLPGKPVAGEFHISTTEDNQIVIQITDRQTGEVIRMVPPGPNGAQKQ